MEPTTKLHHKPTIVLTPVTVTITVTITVIITVTITHHSHRENFSFRNFRQLLSLTNTKPKTKGLPSSLTYSICVHSIISEPRKAKPILKTDEPICPDGKLSCGDGECLDKELFCNGKPDCKDESDENACCKS